MADTTVSKHYKDQFSEDLLHIFKQRGGKLRNTIKNRPLAAENGFFDYIGSSSVQELTTKGTTPDPVEIEKLRRQCDMRKYAADTTVDKFDMLLAHDYRMEFIKDLVNSHGINMDQKIVEKIKGTAYTGRSGETPVTLPSSQVIPKNLIEATGAGGGTNTNITYAKIRQSYKKFSNNFVVDGMDPDEMPVLLVTPNETHQLYIIAEGLGLENWTTATFMGQKVPVLYNHRIVEVNESVLPTKTGDSTTRELVAYVPRAVNFCIGQEIETNIEYQYGPRQWKIFTDVMFGISRVQEEGVHIIEVDTTLDTA